MKRTMIVMFALAMLLAWSGSAMATNLAHGNNALLKAASDECKIGSTKMFDTTLLASNNQLLTIPYAAASQPDVFRTGFALINKGSLEAHNIVANSLCIVGVKADGRAVSKLYGNRLVSGAIATEVVDLLGENWDKDMIIGVFQNQNVGLEAGDKLNGFYIIGDGTQAQGAFALRGVQNGTDELVFDYVPGDPFAGGVAIFNNDNQKRANLRVEVTFSDGQETIILDDRDRIEVERSQMIVKTYEDLIPGWNPAKAAQVKFINEDTANGDPGSASLFAYTFFGDGSQAYGYSSPAPQPMD